MTSIQIGVAAFPKRKGAFVAGPDRITFVIPGSSPQNSQATKRSAEAALESHALRAKEYLDVIDLADVYLESAKQRIRDPRVSFKPGDATSLPFADKSFDRAFSMLVLQFVPDANKAVNEMRRVVRPGGTVAAAVWDSFGGMPGMRLFWDAAANLGIADDKVLRDFYFRPMTRPNDMRAAWRDAGLKHVEQSSITIRFEYENFSDYWLPIAAGEGALGKFAISLKAEQRDALEAAVRNVYLGGAPDGTRSFATTAWVCKGIV